MFYAGGVAKDNYFDHFKMVETFKERIMVWGSRIGTRLNEFMHAYV